MNTDSESGGLILRLLGGIALVLLVVFLVGVCAGSNDRDCSAYQDNTCPAPDTTVSAEATMTARDTRTVEVPVPSASASVTLFDRRTNTQPLP